VLTNGLNIRQRSTDVPLYKMGVSHANHMLNVKHNKHR